MATHVVLLRAVNVAGYGKVSMAALREMLEGLGYRNVKTYIQSGNAVVDAAGSAKQVAAEIRAGLEKVMGARTEVMVRSHAELEKVITGNPYAREAAADGSKVHVVFLAGPAGATAQAALEAVVAKYPARRDRFVLAGSHIYLHLPDGAGETKFSGKSLDRAMGVAGTGRNWNTVIKLHAMAGSKEPAGAVKGK